MTNLRTPHNLLPGGGEIINYDVKSKTGEIKGRDGLIYKFSIKDYSGIRAVNQGGFLAIVFSPYKNRQVNRTPCKGDFIEFTYGEDGDGNLIATRWTYDKDYRRAKSELRKNRLAAKVV